MKSLRPRALIAAVRRRLKPPAPAVESAGQQLLRAFARSYPKAFFIEIGSNDGDQHDHLRPTILSGSWGGIMIEPIPYVFERLQRNYGGVERVSLENAAIADHDGHMTLYHLAEASDDEREGLPPWYDAIGSFSRDAVLSHKDKIPDIEDRLLSTDVPCMTFEALCAKHAVTHFDLLLIDTEGYDWEILQRIDLAAYRPRLLIYEHYHLPAPLRAKCRNHIEALGYETLPEGFDTWCLDTSTDDDLVKAWKQLRPISPAFSFDEHPA